MRSKKHLKYALVSVLLILSASLVLIGCTAKNVKVSGVSSPDSNVVKDVQKDIERREYHASKNTKGLQAPNRAHNLRTYFDKDGITIEDRTAEGSPMLVKMTLAEMGRKGLIREITKDNSVVTTKDNRIEIAHSDITEWYINTAKGLEQGFTVKEKPEGEGQLIVGINVEGAEGRLKGDKILLKTDMGRELEYGKLKVTDRNGTEVPSEMGVTGEGTIQIAVNDGEAVYPIIIDPLITGVPDAFVEFDAPEDPQNPIHPYQQGSAYLGFSVSGAGNIDNDEYDDVLVGAYNYDTGLCHGAVFVYFGSIDGLDQASMKMLECEDTPTIYPQFGRSVSGAGYVDDDPYADVIIGAPQYDNGEGAVYIFYGDDDRETFGSRYSRMTGGEQFNSQMGYSVSGAGKLNADDYDDVIIGAPYFGSISGITGGAVYVYYAKADGSGIETSFDPLVNLRGFIRECGGSSLGWSVSGAGDVDGDGYDDVIVGDKNNDEHTNCIISCANCGSAYIMRGSDTGLGDFEGLDTDNISLEDNDNFGWSVSGAGDVDGDGYADVIVGVPNRDIDEDPETNTDEGAAFVYFGCQVDIINHPECINGIDTGKSPVPLESDQEGAYFGGSVSGAGDVNGDGYADVVIGAYQYDTPEHDSGAAFVYLGEEYVDSEHPGISTSPYVILDNDNADAWMGYSVSGAGDINYDGYADVIVGEPYYSDPLTMEGAFFVYHGGIVFDSLTHDSTDPLQRDWQSSSQTVTWTASAIGGSGQYEYRFWMYGPETNNVWVIKQDYSSNNQYEWTVDDTDDGSTAFWVVIKDTLTGKTVTGGYDAFVVQVITDPPISFSSLTHNSTDPLQRDWQDPPQTVTWTASASGGTGQYEYSFWMYGPETDFQWVKKQDYSTNNQYVWTVDDTDDGGTTIWVGIRDLVTHESVDGSYTDFEVQVIADPPISFSSLTHNSTDPLVRNAQDPPQTVTWTASASGGTGQYEYSFWMYGPETSYEWVKKQDYSSNNQYEWTVDDTDEGLTTIYVGLIDTVTHDSASGSYYDFEVQVQ